MDEEAPNFRARFLKSPHHVALAFLTLGLGLASAHLLGFVAGAAAYALGWIYLPDMPFFRRWVEKEREDRRRAAEAAQVAEFIRRRDALLDALTPQRRELYESLAGVCRDIERASADNPLDAGATQADPRLRKLDELMWTYLRLLGIEESLQRFVETERGEDVPGLLRQADEEAKRVAAEVEKLQNAGGGSECEAKKRLFASLGERAQVLRKRRERCRQADLNLELVAAERDRLVQQVKLIRADAVATRNAEALTSRIDATVEHLGQTNKWLSELDEFKDLVGDMPATDARIGFESTPVVPPLPSAQQDPPPRFETDQRRRARDGRFRGREGTLMPPALKGWALEMARRWNSGAYALFVLHGNVFDVFPAPDKDGVGYAPLKTFLARRIFPDRGFLLFYDIGEGLTFGTADMQTRFFRWLEVYDAVEHTEWHVVGPPRDFARLAPILRRFFVRMTDDPGERRGATLVIDFAEKIVPAAEGAGASADERTALVTLLKWASSPDMRRVDAGVILVTETAGALSADIVQNPHVAQVRIDLPDADDRLQFLQSEWVSVLTDGKPAAEWSDLAVPDLALRTAGLNLLRVQQLLAEAVRNGSRVTPEHVGRGKKRLIEEFCQGLVRFKDPKPGVSLDVVATHAAAKKRLRELAWLIRNAKLSVLERGILVPGRVGVGKSFLIDCFAAECGLPVMEMGEFRSKWVGDTERQQARILITIRALGPVIVVVDEADSVFGNRDDGGDSGVSSRVFAAFAAHIGDSSLRGRELWVAMTSRPDLLAIDMKRQGRFGLCLPLFPAQGADDVVELFATIAKTRRMKIPGEMNAWIRETLGDRPLTGSDVEAILVRAAERAVLAKRDDDVQVADVEEAVNSFIDPLDAGLLALQELAAVLACSDRRFLPERWAAADRGEMGETFAMLKARSGRR